MTNEQLYFTTGGVLGAMNLVFWLYQYVCKGSYFKYVWWDEEPFETAEVRASYWMFLIIVSPLSIVAWPGTVIFHFFMLCFYYRAYRMNNADGDEVYTNIRRKIKVLPKLLQDEILVESKRCVKLYRGEKNDKYLKGQYLKYLKEIDKNLQEKLALDNMRVVSLLKRINSCGTFDP